MSKSSAGNKANLNAKKKAKRKARRAEHADLKIKAQQIAVSIPRNIRVVPFDSEEFKELAEKCEGYTNAKGIALGHIGQANSPSEDWFNELVVKEGVPTEAKDFNVEAQRIRDTLFACIKSNAQDPRIIDIESNFYKKFGDFKKLPWHKWHQVVTDMYKVPDWNPHHKTLRESIRELINLFPKKIKPLTLTEAYQNVPKDANSGMPFNTKQWASDESMVTYYMEEAKDLLTGIVPPHPALLFTRRQPKGLGTDDVKMRAVECPPKSDAIAGSIFLRPLYSQMKELEPFMGYKGAAAIGNNMQTALSLYPYAFEGDFSAFDSKVWTWWMEIIFLDVLPNIFQGDHSDYFNALCKWYSTMPLVTPNGIFHGTHGLFSGCIWTNVIGSFVNFIATTYTLKRMGFDNCEYMNLSFGDDIAIFSEREIDMDLFESFMREVSMDCNKQKQAQSSGEKRMISFLSFYHLHGYWERTDDYIGVYPTLRSLPALIFRERMHDYDKDEAMALGNLTRQQFDTIRYAGKIENWRSHPLKKILLEKLTSLGFKLQPLSPESKDGVTKRTRSSFDRNIQSLWIAKEGMLTFSSSSSTDNVNEIEDTTTKEYSGKPSGIDTTTGYKVVKHHEYDEYYTYSGGNNNELFFTKSEHSCQNLQDSRKNWMVIDAVEHFSCDPVLLGEIPESRYASTSTGFSPDNITNDVNGICSDHSDHVSESPGRGTRRSRGTNRGVEDCVNSSYHTVLPTWYDSSLVRLHNNTVRILPLIKHDGREDNGRGNRNLF